MKQNPYSLLFGKEPMQEIPRTADEDLVLSSFCADPSPQQVFILTGVRGSGKTVLMSGISKEIKARKGWEVFELNPERNLLEDFASKMGNRHDLAGIFRKAEINLSFFGIELGIGGSLPLADAEIAVSRMLESLKNAGRRVLVTIDEVSSTPQMREFIHAYQIFIRNDLPVYLLMTGLYESVDTLQNEKSLTFLYRAPKIRLEPLSVRTIASRYRDTFDLDQAAASEMAAMTRGYPFAFQVLGYFTWKKEGNYQEAAEEYKQYLYDYSYDKIWAEMSLEDRRIAHAAALSEDGKIAGIRSHLGIDTNHFNPYRKRLIRKGVLNGEQYGYVRFELPYFREYVLENY